MLEKRTVLEQIEVRDNDIVGIKLQKQIVDNGVVIQSSPHRADVHPLISVAELVGIVNDGLEQMGFPPMPDEAVAKLSAHVGLAHTDDVKVLWQKRIADPEQTIDRS